MNTLTLPDTYANKREPRKVIRMPVIVKILLKNPKVFEKINMETED